MEITLMKIKQLRFDEIVDQVMQNYVETDHVYVNKEHLEECSEKITINGKEIVCDIDVNKYKEIVNTNDYAYVKLANVGMQLHKDLVCNDGTKIPRSILYQKEVWSYLSLTVFVDIIGSLRSFNRNDYEDKIKKMYFNCGGISRTCLLFAWCMIDRLDSENDPEMSLTAFEFIDPVKAIFERTFSRSPLILKAFVQGIINNKKDYRFKNDPYRRTVPNNISCYAAVNVLETLDYETLVSTITEQQRLIIN